MSNEDLQSLFTYDPAEPWSRVTIKHVGSLPNVVVVPDRTGVGVVLQPGEKKSCELTDTMVRRIQHERSHPKINKNTGLPYPAYAIDIVNLTD